MAIRGAFSTDSSDGYIRNINPESTVSKGGQGKFRAGRLQARYEGVGFNVNLKAEFGRNDTKIWGGELELQAQPIDGPRVLLGAGYVESKIKGICNPTGAVPAGCAPNQPAFRASLPLSPKFTGNFLVRYEWGAFGGTPFVQASGRGQAKMFRGSLNNQANTIGSGFTTDATVGFKGPNDHWKLALWVNNLFDSQHEVNAFEISGVAGVGEIVYQMPRWFGGTVTVNFLT